jgi:hypothetical protein
MKIEPLPPAQGMLPGFVRFAAKIHYDQRWWRPEILWFDLPGAHSEEVRVSGDAWMLALLPAAYHWRESLEVAAPVDPVLLQHAAEIQQVWNSWTPQLQPVPVFAATQGIRTSDRERRVGLFFSAGVDSFFTLLHYDAGERSQSSAIPRFVDDLLYVWGYDIPLAHREAWEQKRSALADVARESGKHFIPIVSNLRETRLRKLAWGRVTHGSALGAAGLLLGRRYGRLLISSGGKLADLHAWGSHPRVDPLFSTSGTEVIRYQGDSDRFEKTAYLADSGLALRHLHVCWMGGTAKNCGRCEKCLRTLVALDVLGKRQQARSFPPLPWSLDFVRQIRLGGTTDHLITELIPHAKLRGRLDIVAALEACLASNRDRRTAEARSPWRRFKHHWKAACRRWLPFTAPPEP